MLRVLLINREPLTRHYLKARLSNGLGGDVTVLGQAADYATALPLVRRLRPDVVLAELTSADGTGLEIAQRLHVDCPNARTIVVTGRVTPYLDALARSCGAAGVIARSEVCGAALRRALGRSAQTIPTPMALPRAA